MQKQFSQDPKTMLQTAIEDLDIFTQSEALRLEVKEDGRLFAAKESRLERVMSLARCYIGPLFSDQVKKKQEKRLNEIKKAILQARDIIQSHSPLLEKFKEGDESQRKWAESALLAIQRYNAIVAPSSETMNSDVYNYELQQLLLDQEIKGQQIELPHTISIKYDSHPDAHPAHKMLRELSQVFRVGVSKTSTQSLTPTYKKTLQFMIDTFQMKAIRMMQKHVQYSMAEIVSLVKQTPPEIDEESSTDIITMWQLIDAGSLILVTGCFKRNAPSSKFMTMPILDSFRSFPLTHSGFPYPSQHTGWALDDKWIEASPLRFDQVPLFHQLNQRRKRLVHQLIFDKTFIQKMRQHFKIKREIFDQNRHLFLPLHRQLQQALHQEISKDYNCLLDIFYQELACAPSAFDILVRTQQEFSEFFIQQPIKALEEEWLGVATTPLRIGSPQEKLQTARLRFEQHYQKIQEQFDSTHVRHAYMMQQGLVLGQAFRSIGLQYQSEKMGFSPPLLNDFERKLQVCAFQQLLAFLNECEHRLDIKDSDQIKSDLLAAWSQDLNLLEGINKEENRTLPWLIVNELEVYFTSRFYSRRS